MLETFGAKDEGPPAAASGQAPAPLDDAQIQALVAEALAKGREAAPDFTPRRVDIDLTPDTWHGKKPGLACNRVADL